MSKEQILRPEGEKALNMEEIDDIENVVVGEGDEDIVHHIDQTKQAMNDDSDSEPFYDLFAIKKHTNVFVEDPDKDKYPYQDTDGKA